MAFSEQQIETLSPSPAAFNAGKSLAAKNKWKSLAQNERAAWGEIQGSGKNPYQAQVEIGTLACKCNCPSRQFPCKHNLALMLLFAKVPNEFAQTPDEPEWVNRVTPPDIDLGSVADQQLLK